MTGDVTGDVTGTVSDISNHDTDALAEGTNKLYFTDARARSAISVSGDLTYNSTTGVISTQGLASSDTDDLSEGTTNLYYTNARFDTRLAAKDTDDVSEGSSNLYYTDARWDSRLSTKNTDDMSEGSTNLYYTDGRADARVALATGANLSLTNQDTDDLSEGTSNLYYTDARANTAFDTRLATKDTDDVSEGSSNLFYTDARVGSYLTTNSYATQAFVTAAVQGVDNSDEITEGSSNLFFTNERAQDAVMANVSAGTGISVSYDDAAGTLTVTNTQTEVNDYVDGATFSGGTLTLSVGTQSDVSVSLDGRYAQLGNTSKKHTHAYETTAQDETDNTGSTHSITWATLTSGKISLGSDAVDFASEINDSPYAVVYINRIMARPNEVTITSTGLTFASDVLAEDDEVEVVYLDEQ